MMTGYGTYFKDTPVEPPFSGGKPAYLIKKPSTSLVGSGLSKTMAKLPRPLNQMSGPEFDAAVKILMGNTGTAFVDTTDDAVREMMQGMGMKVAPKHPGSGIDKFTGRITSKTTERPTTKWSERFWKYYTKTSIAKSENDATTDLYVATPYDLRMSELFEEIKSDISKDNKEIAEILESDYPDEYKTKRLKEHYVRTNEWMKYAVTRYEKGKR
jgi:hypothetical protein